MLPTTLDRVCANGPTAVLLGSAGRGFGNEVVGKRCRGVEPLQFVSPEFLGGPRISNHEPWTATRRFRVKATNPLPRHQNTGLLIPVSYRSTLVDAIFC